ncbi:hypothetical protein IX39_18390 [Chryseobacterium formosense]|uniref:YcxB-like protein domain-containing protein n=1 Tax=Chryseobacterium formosense TaxID=236814 RepID=A0A085YZX4_9FLAO|nr:YcxB family protein [Chryseobacterium formosense]KFE97737.1 hypothetical protein IX39_18390 [Chryseobacterium formosense]SFT84159.1 hypothetical protein SAMN05421857_3642 [Chryseobacterium formosense]
MNKEILTYNTPNSEQILRKINQYEFKRQWKNNLNKNNRNLIYGVLSLLAGILLYCLKDFGFAGFFFGFSLATISTYFNYRSQFRNYKKVFQEKLNHEINRINTNSKDVIWEFTPSHFSFKNYKSEFKFLWSEITYCILDDQYLYINASSIINFILDKANLDEENMNKTIKYLEKYSRFKEV